MPNSGTRMMPPLMQRRNWHRRTSQAAGRWKKDVDDTSRPTMRPEGHNLETVARSGQHFIVDRFRPKARDLTMPAMPAQRNSYPAARRF